METAERLGMIDEVDKAIEALLKRELPPEFSALTISFATPDAQFPPALVPLPAVDLFLFDLRENMDTRNNEPLVERLGNGMAKKTPPPVRVDCSYLVTVWPDPKSANPASDEHAIFGAVMKVLLAYPTLPAELLPPNLQESQKIAPTASLRPGVPPSPADLLQAVAGRPKLSLNYSVTFSMPVRAPEQEPIVTEKQIRFRLWEQAAGD